MDPRKVPNGRLGLPQSVVRVPVVREWVRTAQSAAAGGKLFMCILCSQAARRHVGLRKSRSGCSGRAAEREVSSGRSVVCFEKRAF